MGNKPTSRSDLKRLGYMDLHGASDLLAYGWMIRYWFCPKTLDTAIEYVPRSDCHNNQTKEVVIQTYEEQAAFHRRIGAPVFSRGQPFIGKVRGQRPITSLRQRDR